MSHVIRSLCIVFSFCVIAEALPADPPQLIGLRRDFLAMEAWMAGHASARP